MLKFLRAAAGGVVLVAGLAACGGGGGEPAATEPGAVAGELLSLAAPPPAESPSGECALAEEKFASQVDSLAPGELMQVVVTFEGAGGVNADQLGLLNGMGLSGRYMQRLPIAGVLATADQIAQLRATDGVRSVRHNAPVTFDDATARYLTSVDRTIESPELTDADGNPIDGSGVTILINDSGLDATHQDLLFGEKVVANATAYTNARAQGDLVPGLGMLPFTPLEGVPNTDVGGSHGTHVAGIAGGDGTLSDGEFAGVARGASIAGYGSGAVLLILDTIGGFDYAMKLLDERPELNLRIVSNSFGSPGDVGTCFDPDDPTNVATKVLADRGVIVVFSAGNSGSGPGTITGNFKKAPWIMVAGNGEKSGLLAPSSSRGVLTGGVYQVEVDGEILTVEDRPTVVTPGTNYISTRAIAADPFLPLDAQADIESGDIPPTLVPFYTMKTGTSMAAPHLAGLIALVLQANPELTWREVKPLLKQTATNMPGYEPWEVGAGFANAEAAVAMALAKRDDYGPPNYSQRGFHASVGLGDGTVESYSIDFAPVGPVTSESFEVGDDIALILAQWTQPLGDPCTCAVVLTDPEGNTYGSGIALPVLGSTVAAVAPGMPGTWEVTARGIGSVSGVAVDPTGSSNGVAGPSTLDINVTQLQAGEPVGVADAIGHPAEAMILAAVGERLMDGTPQGFQPDATLIRAHLAEYLMAWGVRQTRSHDGSAAFSNLSDVPAVYQVAADVTTRPGALILADSEASAPLILDSDGQFDAFAPVTLEQALYALIQAKGLEDAAVAAAEQPLTWTDAEGNMLDIADADAVDARYLGHVAVALSLGLVDPTPNGDGTATLQPTRVITRADYAAIAVKALAAVPFPG